VVLHVKKGENVSIIYMLFPMESKGDGRNTGRRIKPIAPPMVGEADCCVPTHGRTTSGTLQAWCHPSCKQGGALAMDLGHMTPQTELDPPTHIRFCLRQNFDQSPLNEGRFL